MTAPSSCKKTGSRRQRVFPPLSTNPLLSTQLGTRHRAGIGITEETDAIAVICSEETGAISLAIGGSIERDLTVDQLRKRLGADEALHGSGKRRHDDRAER